ncbi:MAG: hypothetical protein GJT30_03950 [Geobacter sp.]|nr:hypothetical protein [Geobacter sp.]MSM38760.1 hypothetical protein [Geobacter sp.]
MKSLISATIAALAPTATAFAASGAREDNSGIYSTIFLGLCALIVIGQLVPAAMVMLGFAKGLRKEAKTEA